MMLSFCFSCFFLVYTHLVKGKGISMEKEKEKESHHITVSRTPRSLFFAFLVGCLMLITTGFCFKEGKNDKYSHWMQQIFNSIGWAFSSLGGGLLASVIFSVVLPGPLKSILHDLQNHPYGV